MHESKPFIHDSQDIFRIAQRRNYSNLVIMIRPIDRRVMEVIICTHSDFSSLEDFNKACNRAREYLEKKYPMWPESIMEGGAVGKKVDDFFWGMGNNLLYDPNLPITGEDGPPIVRNWDEALKTQ